MARRSCGSSEDGTKETLSGTRWTILQGRFRGENDWVPDQFSFAQAVEKKIVRKDNRGDVLLMIRWKLTLEYDGTGFCGWQKQTNALSVQQVLEESIQKFSGETVALHVAGRTDAGVHALGQVAHFDLARETTADEIQGAINYHVKPHRVVALKVEKVSSDFHARFGALSRSYRYDIVNRRAPLALLADLAWHTAKPLNVAAMREAAAFLIGQHDFSTFRAANCQSNSPIKTLDQLDITQDGEMISFHTRARSFLYHQVRNMVGTLVLVGTGQWSVDAFAQALAAADRTKGGPTAPAQGLFFVEVRYP